MHERDDHSANASTVTSLMLATWSLSDRTLRPHPGRKEYVSSSLLRKGSWIAVQSVPEFGVPSRTSPRGPSKCRVSVQNLATATVASTTSWPEDVLDWLVAGCILYNNKQNKQCANSRLLLSQPRHVRKAPSATRTQKRRDAKATAASVNQSDSSPSR